MSGAVVRLRESIRAIPPAPRILMLCILALILSGSVYLWASSYAARSKYEPLYYRLDPRDAAEILDKLDQRKVPYQISPDGSTILVPQNMLHATRLSLAGEGLPRGGTVGFELMDKVSLGATDFDRRVNYLRALTGELTRTIREIDGVEDARVHIVLPENTYFVSTSKPATAAVFLKLRPMFELSKPQVNGIVHLVSRSVEGLKPEDVVIIDLYGRLLSGDVLSSGVGSEFHHGTNLELQHAFQTELERSLQSLLERVLGPGNVVTKVTAELNFDQKTVDTILFQPHDTGITRSIQELEETFKGSGTTPSGVPGVTSNIPQYQAQTVTGESEWNRSESVRNYEISEIKERTVVAPGSVKRLSVAVVVNRELDEDARQAIVNTVSAAIGYDADRNDIVTITGIAFDTSLIDAIKKQMEHEASPVDDSPARSTLIRNIALGGGGALLLLLFFVVFRRRPARAPSARPRVDVEAALAAAAELAAAEESREPDPAQEKRKRTRGEIEQAARQNPENVARLIKTWLQEDRR